MEALKQYLMNIVGRNPRIAKLIVAIFALYILNKVYQKRKYSQKLFTTKSEIENKVILITGCDTGSIYFIH